MQKLQFLPLRVELTLLFLFIKQMKRNMKLMKIYEIEKNYQRHKERLLCINTTDNKVKTLANINTNIDKINSFKRGRIQSETFTDKERTNKIFQENLKIHQKMEDLYHRPSSVIRDSQLRRNSSSKSLKNTSINSKRVLEQNMRLKQRLSKTKSNYYKINHHPKQKQYNITGEKRQKQMIYLLEKQLGIKPMVVFPKCKTEQRQSRNIINKKSSVVNNRQNKTEAFGQSTQLKKEFNTNKSVDLYKN